MVQTCYMYADIVDSLNEKALFLFTAYDSHQGRNQEGNARDKSSYKLQSNIFHQVVLTDDNTNSLIRIFSNWCLYFLPVFMNSFFYFFKVDTALQAYH